MEQESKERYAPDVESYEGRVPAWLMVIYAVLLVWGIYYLVAYWGDSVSGG
ncbi:MAG TPA: cbb3-type cytochrome c oxidase N-terminal domain-containing protein [Syntrophales bacterium]|nr:cbb3-type cytochrome c oxidase N-terminal domain-containing protein [Syntrophales bacterium]